MKKLLLMALAITVFSPSLFAESAFIPFTTLQQAQQFCPPLNGLYFTSNNVVLPHSKGSIVGNNRISFESTPHAAALHPKNINTNGLILDVTFRSTEGGYGYLSNNTVTCFYSYTTFIDTPYTLVLRG